MPKLIVTPRMIDVAKDTKAIGMWRMRPLDFLLLTTDVAPMQWIAHEESETQPLEQYNAWARSGEITVPPFLDVDASTGKVRAHEGRHRCAALVLEGHREVDVAITVLRNGIRTYYEQPFFNSDDSDKWHIKRYLSTSDVPPVFKGQFRSTRVRFVPEQFTPFYKA